MRYSAEMEAWVIATETTGSTDSEGLSAWSRSEAWSPMEAVQWMVQGYTAVTGARKFQAPGSYRRPWRRASLFI